VDFGFFVSAVTLLGFAGARCGNIRYCWVAYGHLVGVEEEGGRVNGICRRVYGNDDFNCPRVRATPTPDWITVSGII
jgi:hypothetical protein